MRAGPELLYGTPMLSGIIMHALLGFKRSWQTMRIHSALCAASGDIPLHVHEVRYAT